MMKGWFVLIMAALLLPSVGSAGNTPCHPFKSSISAKAVLKQVCCSNDAGEQAAAVLTSQDICGTGFTPNNYHPRINGFAGCIAAKIDPASIDLAAALIDHHFVQHKKYLSYIFPSHNFW